MFSVDLFPAARFHVNFHENIPNSHFPLFSSSSLSAPPTFQSPSGPACSAPSPPELDACRRNLSQKWPEAACLSGGWDVYERRALRSSLVISFPRCFLPSPSGSAFSARVSNLKIMVGRFYESRSGEETRAQTERISLSKDWCLVL